MRILFVEDDAALCAALNIHLKKAGYTVDFCPDGQDALFYAFQNTYDVILLDRMLPGLDGLTLLHAIRSKGIHTPVIMVTALDAIPDRIQGLDAGADDYLVKPFDIWELLARIRALTRRPAAMLADTAICCGDVTLDTDRRELTCQETVSLSKKETMLLEYLIRHKGQTLSRSVLLSYVWGPDSEIEEGNLDNYIYFLRRRLRAVKSTIQIKTAHGIGYRLEEAGGSGNCPGGTYVS